MCVGIQVFIYDMRFVSESVKVFVLMSTSKLLKATQQFCPCHISFFHDQAAERRRGTDLQLAGHLSLEHLAGLSDFFRQKVEITEDEPWRD